MGVAHIIKKNDDDDDDVMMIMNDSNQIRMANIKGIYIYFMQVL